jgi:hypothetical protein
MEMALDMTFGMLGVSMMGLMFIGGLLLKDCRKRRHSLSDAGSEDGFNADDEESDAEEEREKKRLPRRQVPRPGLIRSGPVVVWYPELEFVQMGFIGRPLPPIPLEEAVYASEEEGYIQIDVERELADEPIYATAFDF